MTCANRGQGTSTSTARGSRERMHETEGIRVAEDRLRVRKRSFSSVWSRSCSKEPVVLSTAAIFEATSPNLDRHRFRQPTNTNRNLRRDLSRFLHALSNFMHF